MTLSEVVTLREVVMLYPGLDAVGTTQVDGIRVLMVLLVAVGHEVEDGLQERA